MSALVHRLLERYFHGAPHPYRLISRFHALRFLRSWIMVTLVKPAA